MADSSPSAAAAVSPSTPTDVSSVDAADLNEPTNQEQEVTASGAKPQKPKAKPEPKKEAAASEDDDPEEDFEGEKVRRSQLREVYKRQKEFERASHARMQQAAEQRKQVEAQQQELVRLANMLRAKEQGADPFALHRAAGATDDEIDAIAEQRLVQRLKRAQMTPEQVEAEATARRVQQLEQQLKERDESDKNTRQAQLKQDAVKYWDQQIGHALEHGNLARNADTAREVADVMLQYFEAKTPITPEMAASIVQDNHDTKTRHRFTWLRDQLNASRITSERYMAIVSDLIGSDSVKAIQQAAIKKAKDFEPQKPKDKVLRAPPKQGFDSFEEANAWIEGKMKQNG